MGGYTHTHNMSLPIVEQMLDALEKDPYLSAQDWWMDEFGLPDDHEDGIRIGDMRWAVLEGAEPYVDELKQYFDVRTLGTFYTLILVPWGSRPIWD